MSTVRTCEDCGQAYGLVDSCTHARVRIDGRTLGRQGTYEPGRAFSCNITDASERCYDCGVLLGKIHHYGCEVEECPACRESFATCEHEAERV